LAEDDSKTLNQISLRKW